MTNPADLCPCDGCARPRHGDWSICAHHAWALERDLGDIPALVDELDTSLSRQGAVGPRVGGRSSESPLPYASAPSEAGWVLRNVLVGWVRDLEPEGSRWPADTMPAMALWLLGRIDLLRTHPAADEIVGEVGSAVAAAWRVVDRRAERLYAGTCDAQGCQEGLYVPPGRPTVACRACGATHDVQGRREAMRAALEGRAMTVREIARAAAALGEFPDTARTERRLNLWIHREKTEPHGVDPRGRPTYRFGEVHARLVETFGQL